MSPESCQCFWKSSPRRGGFSEAWNTWLRRKGGGCMGESGWCPRVSGISMPTLPEYMHMRALHQSQSDEVSLEDDGNDLLRSLELFTHAAEAPSCPKSCPGKLSIYSTNATRTRRIWNSSLGLLVSLPGKYPGKPPKVAILSFEGKFGS